MFGARTKAGFLDSAAWATSFSPATKALPVVSESLVRSYQLLRSQALIGQVAAHEFENGIMMVSGDIVQEVDYNAMDLLEYCLGNESSGVFTLTDDVDDYFHFEIDKITERFRFQSCAVNNWSLAANSESENPMAFTMNVTARSGIYSATAFPSISAPANTRAYWSHMPAGHIRIGNLANALGSGDDMVINSWEVAGDNNLRTDDQDTSTATYAIAPVRDGFRTITCKVGFNRYNADLDTLIAHKDAGDALQIEIYAYDSTGSLKAEIPNCKITGGGEPSVGGPGAMAGEVTFECFYNGTGGSQPNTAMSVEDQLQITVT